MIFIKILALIASWIFFYQILKSKNKRIPKIKATIITLLFASFIMAASTDLYAKFNRFIFSLNESGEIPLSDSALKIPSNQNDNYCSQFTDQNNKPIQIVSQRSDGRYCGAFWRFNIDSPLMVPYKIINSNTILYWASPSLKIIEIKNTQSGKN